MKTTVNSKSLASALSKLSPAIQAKSTLPIMECVRIVVEGSRMTLSATNLDMNISALVECETKKNGNGSCCVAFGRLSKAVAAVGGNIDLIHKDGKLTLKAGKTNVIYLTLPVSDWQEMEGISELSEGLEVEGLLQCLESVAYAAYEKQDRYVLHSVCFNNDAVCSTDGRVMAMARVNTGIECVAPIELIQALIKSKPAAVTLSSSDKLVSFDCGDIKIIGKTIDSPYPGWRGLIKDHSASIQFNRDELVSVITRGGLAGDRIFVTCGNEKIVVASNSGEDKSQCETSAKGVFETGFGCALNNVMDALSACRTEVITFGVSPSPAGENLIRIDSGEDTHIILPMRIEPIVADVKEEDALAV